MMSHHGESSLEPLPGSQICRLRLLGPIVFGARELGAEGGGDRVDHVVLELEDLGVGDVVFLGPEMAAAAGLDQLDGRAQPISDSPDAAFEDVADAELSADLPDVDRLALLGEARVASDYEEMAIAGKPREDVLRHAIGQELRVGIVRHIREGQDRDRGSIRDEGEASRGLGLGRFLRLGRSR
jgi:hypothetical protein